MQIKQDPRVGLEVTMKQDQPQRDHTHADLLAESASEDSSSHPTTTPPSAPMMMEMMGDDDNDETSATKHPTDNASGWSFEALPDEFHRSPEPLLSSKLSPSRQNHHVNPFGSSHNLQQIQENASILEYNEEEEERADAVPRISSTFRSREHEPYFTPHYRSTRWICALSARIFKKEQDEFCMATWIGFWSLFAVTMGVSTITPIRDAIALQVGVKHMPKLTLASSVLAFLSSVPIGWLFEAPDPSRRKLWKSMGLTRGETQGSSLALFYRFFALTVASYALAFIVLEIIQNRPQWIPFLSKKISKEANPMDDEDQTTFANLLGEWVQQAWQKIGEFMYIAFFLVVHLMKLHSISLVWGVTTEAMEYEDVARKARESKLGGFVNTNEPTPFVRTRLQRLALVGFGGTLGGILGSVLASELVNLLHLPGLLLVSAILLEISAQFSVELGRIMQKHWEEQQLFKSTQDLAGLDASMRRSTSLGSMKRVASGNSLMKRVSSGNSMTQSNSVKSLASLDNNSPTGANETSQTSSPAQVAVDENTFTQRLLRGITTILKSRLLMAIFTYNALFASTTVLLSFQRAELVANRREETTVAADTAFLAKINMASSIAVFTMQASGIGARIAHSLGPQGALALMPVIRLLGVLSLAWWHHVSSGKPPNLILFLMLDECTRVVNLAVAKPVRESLWRGLSNEARYEAKPIVDTLANRWGAGSASFCVSTINRILIYLGPGAAATIANGEIFGLPPIIFLCLLVAAWWAMVSLDLGQIRRKIDMELKKRQ